MIRIVMSVFLFSLKKKKGEATLAVLKGHFWILDSGISPGGAQRSAGGAKCLTWVGCIEGYAPEQLQYFSSLKQPRFFSPIRDSTKLQHS